jgi:hypothetical protein
MIVPVELAAVNIRTALEVRFCRGWVAVSRVSASRGRREGALSALGQVET